MNDKLSARDEGSLAHNLAREWITDRLMKIGGEASIAGEWANVQSEYRGSGPGFPTEVGEHQEPVEAEIPHFVNVYIALPPNYSEDQVNRVIERLNEDSEQDPELGCRVGHAHIDEKPTAERQDNHDLGQNAWRITVRFVVREPRFPSDA